MDRITSSPPFLEAIESLKALKKSSWASTSVPEPDSLSEHIYQMALVCLAHPDVRIPPPRLPMLLLSCSNDGIAHR